MTIMTSSVMVANSMMMITTVTPTMIPVFLGGQLQEVEPVECDHGEHVLTTEKLSPHDFAQFENSVHINLTLFMMICKG